MLSIRLLNVPLEKNWTWPERFSSRFLPNRFDFSHDVAQGTAWFSRGTSATKYLHFPNKASQKRFRISKVLNDVRNDDEVEGDTQIRSTCFKVVARKNHFAAVSLTHVL